MSPSVLGLIKNYNFYLMRKQKNKIPTIVK